MKGPPFFLPSTSVSHPATVWPLLQTRHIGGRDKNPLTGDLWPHYSTPAATQPFLNLLTLCLSSCLCLSSIMFTISNFAARGKACTRVLHPLCFLRYDEKSCIFPDKFRNLLSDCNVGFGTWSTLKWFFSFYHTFYFWQLWLEFEI